MRPVGRESSLAFVVAGAVASRGGRCSLSVMVLYSTYRTPPPPPPRRRVERWPTMYTSPPRTRTATCLAVPRHPRLRDRPDRSSLAISPPARSCTRTAIFEVGASWPILGVHSKKLMRMEEKSVGGGLVWLRVRADDDDLLALPDYSVIRWFTAPITHPIFIPTRIRPSLRSGPYGQYWEPI